MITNIQKTWKIADGGCSVSTRAVMRNEAGTLRYNRHNRLYQAVNATPSHNTLTRTAITTTNVAAYSRDLFCILYIYFSEPHICHLTYGKIYGKSALPMAATQERSSTKV